MSDTTARVFRPGEKLVLATHNKGKYRENAALLAPYGLEVLSAGELGLPEPDETGLTFEANAVLKARAACAATGLPAIADDSGLEVTALGGEPGIYTARWAGPERDFFVAMTRVHEELGDAADRSGHFVCNLSVAWPDGETASFEGRVGGTLVWPIRGARGFGFDPMFQPQGFDITFGEMDPVKKEAMSHRAVAFAKLARALLADLEHAAEKSGPRRVTSVFFGGGTPSLMPPETVAAVLQRIDALWGLAPGTEVTLEANPTSAEADRFAGFAQAGVNRLSLGVQALDDAALKFLGRQHSAGEARAALELARAAFPRISFDLMYARPGQSLDAWLAELDAALALGPEHISLYQLTIEEGTVFHGAWRRGELVMPAEEDAATLFEATAARLEDAGLPGYEISNHARPGGECRHNLTYWRYEDYAGVGPGAHGRLTWDGAKHATRQHRAPEPWLDLVEKQGHGWRQDDIIDAGQRLAEMVMMGLRLRDGIARRALLDELDAGPEALLDATRLQRLTDEGYLEIDAQGLRATAAGRQRLDALLGYLLA